MLDAAAAASGVASDRFLREYGHISADASSFFLKQLYRRPLSGERIDLFSASNSDFFSCYALYPTNKDGSQSR